MTFRPHLSLCAVLFIALTQSSCVHMSENECRAGDWKAYGFTDAYNDDVANKQPARIRACRGMGVEPDLAAYERGVKEGQKAYCTPFGGWHTGIQGRDLNNSCPQSTAEATLLGYTLGNEVYATQWAYEDAVRRREDNHYDARREGGSSHVRSERMHRYDYIFGTSRADLRDLREKADQTYARNVATFVRLFGVNPF